MIKDESLNRVEEYTVFGLVDKLTAHYEDKLLADGSFDGVYSFQGVLKNIVSLEITTATATPKIYSLILWYSSKSTIYYTLDMPLQVTALS